MSDKKDVPSTGSPEEANQPLKPSKQPTELSLHIAIFQAALWSVGLTLFLLGCAYVVSFVASLLFPNEIWEAKILQQGGVLMALVLYVADFFISLYVILKRAKLVFG